MKRVPQFFEIFGEFEEFLFNYHGLIESDPEEFLDLLQRFVGYLISRSIREGRRIAFTQFQKTEPN